MKITLENCAHSPNIMLCMTLMGIQDIWIPVGMRAQPSLKAAYVDKWRCTEE